MRKMSKWLGHQIERFILGSRYLLVPLLCALLWVILLITLDFIKVIVGMSNESQLNTHTIQALQLLDITMIANLIWLISAGSYYVFVDDGSSTHLRPRCLTHVSAGLLKEKMAGSLIGVSSVYLLQAFLRMENGPVDWRLIGALLAIHGMFIIGLLAFARVNEADHHDHSPDPHPTVAGISLRNFSNTP